MSLNFVIIIIIITFLILEIKRQVLVANNIKVKKSNICFNLLNELFIDFCFFKNLKQKTHTKNITINSKLRLFILKKKRAVKFFKKYR